MKGQKEKIGADYLLHGGPVEGCDRRKMRKRNDKEEKKRGKKSVQQGGPKEKLEMRKKTTKENIGVPSA